MSYELPNDIKPAFNRSQTAYKCEKETRTIKTATSAKTRSNAIENADDLFSISYIPDDCEQTETVMGIMKNHSSSCFTFLKLVKVSCWVQVYVYLI